MSSDASSRSSAVKPSPYKSCREKAPSSAGSSDMGITKGTSIFVRKVAPLGDPVEVATVRGYELSLRKADADMILVE